MKAIVMAGGYGTRLRPLTIKLPKPMLPIANLPMLDHIVRLLVRHGFSHIVMLTYFFPEAIESYFGDGSAWNVSISYRQDPPGGLGTAGAVKNVEDLIDGPFLVISGDVITNFDLTEAVRFHRSRNELATMVLTRVHNPLPFGVVITDADSRVSSFLEKPTWGEVFSDTINTGIYILQPEVLRSIPSDAPSDFSKNIFPRLLQEGTPPGAYVASGYWKDVGNTVEYLQIHREIALGVIVLDVPGTRKEAGGATLYLGKEARVSPDARLSGLVVLGEGAAVDGDARLSDCFIGNRCSIGGGVRMISSVLWDDVKVEQGAFVAGSVLGARTRVKTRANIEQGSIISEDCVIGRGSIVRAGVRIWPDKVVEDEAVLSTHFVWGSRWRGTLFSAGLVRGLANKEITPEFAARLGAAFGATLAKHSTVSISRGIHRSARIMSGALASGILSVGVDVHDYEVVPMPVARHQMRGQGELGGVFVRRSPTDPELLEIRLFRDEGRELTTAERNAVDRLFFRMDFRRASIEDSGTISSPYYGTESYEKSFIKNLNTAAIAEARMRLVVDYSYGSTLKVLPALLGRTGAEVVSLSAHLDEEKASRTTKEFDRAMRQISEIVTGLKARLGVIVSATGETLFAVDERGRRIDGGRMLQALALMVFRTVPGAVVAVPANASGNMEKLAAAHGGSVVRTSVSASALLDAAVSRGAVLAGNGEGGVSFPAFHPSFDAMFCIGKTMEMMAVLDAELGQVVDSLPGSHLLHSVVPCPWEAKGQVMRRLVEELGEGAKAVEGVRFDTNGGWVLIYPSSNSACFHVYSEGADPEDASETLRKWSKAVEEMQR